MWEILPRIDGGDLPGAEGSLTMSGSYTREEVAEMVEEGPRWRDPEFEGTTVHQPDPGMAVLVYQASTARGEGESYRALVGSGYVKRQDGWKMFFHQQTPLPG